MLRAGGRLFFAVEEVAGVAQAGYDVAVVVEHVVDVGGPHGGIDAVGQVPFQVFNGLVGGDNHGNVDVLRRALLQESANCHIHRASGGEHRVGNHQHLSLDARACQIFGANHEIVGAFNVFAISRNKGIFGIVEKAEEALVKRQSGAENGAQHHLIGDGASGRHSQRCGGLAVGIFQAFGNFVSHNLSDALHIGAKPESVGLNIFVAEFEHVSTQ